MLSHLYRFLFVLALAAIPAAAFEQVPVIHNSADVASFFPKNGEQIQEIYLSARKMALASVQQIAAIPADERTFENTVLAYDRAAASFSISGSLIATIKMVHPDPAMRKRAEETIVAWTDLAIDLFDINRDIYRSFKEYAQRQEPLNAERSYYLAEALSGFRRAGLELDAEKFQQMKQLEKQIALLKIQFQSHIAQDRSSLRVKRQELRGLDEAFIKSLPRESGRYVLYCDYPTAYQVLTHCSVESTRRDYFHAFHNRAYPQNLDVLKQLIDARDQLAQILGYRSYAELDIVGEMAKTPDRVEKFLSELALSVYKKVKRDWKMIRRDLPKSVALTPEGKFKGWDVKYASDYFIKRHLHVDREQIAEYFPVETTVQGMLDIFGKFFNLKLQVVRGEEFWDPSVQLIEVREGESLMGYVLMDLFPRENKYSHACCNSLVPPGEGPALAVIITNFSKPTGERPSLLKHHEVKTLFHEFGHAVHALSGRAEMPTRAAYHTTMDFVEMPSQLLEQWIWDSDVLKKISRHYRTGASLPDQLIEGLLQSRGFGDAAHVATSGSGDHEGTAVYMSQLSLNLYKEGSNKNFQEIDREIYHRTPQVVAYDPEMHNLCAFGHLTGYGAKYYSYLWSKQLALKIFDYIQLHGGLLDPGVGERYRAKILGRGGSCDPELLTKDFLEAD